MLENIELISLPLTLMLALVLDRWLGEARNFHYLVVFGNLANALEQRLNTDADHDANAAKPVNDSAIENKRVSAGSQTFKGALAWLLLVLPLPLFYGCLYYVLSDVLTPHYFTLTFILLDSLILYLAIGLNSLRQHAIQVYKPLVAEDLATARRFTGYLVSRETNELTPREMARATTESMLENGHDAVLASLIYYAIGGAPLVILHRFANTLDAMWGYKNSRFLHFGFFAAKADDVLGFVSAKASAILYALCALFSRSLETETATKQPLSAKFSRVKQALSNAAQQAPQYKSLNGGWVMAAGATVLNIQLGGSASYQGKLVKSVTLGQGDKVEIEDIKRSVELVEKAALLFVALVSVIGIICLLSLSF